MSKIVDERIELTKQKIYSEVLSVLLLFLLGSMLYKQFVLQAEVSAYWVELIGFFGAIFYILIRKIVTGSFTYNRAEQRSYRLLKLSLIYAFISTAIVIFGTTNQASTLKSVLFGLIFFIVSLITHFLLSNYLIKIGKKRIETLESKYDDKE